MSLDYIVFNGQKSTDLGIYLLNTRTFPGSSPELTFVSVPGRSGDLIVSNKRFVNYEDTYAIGFKDPDIEEEKIIQIRNWLQSVQSYQKLFDSKFPNYYRWAVCTNAISIDQQLIDFGQASVIFNCKPFRYRIDGDFTITLNSTPTKLFNSELFSSSPYIKVYGSGDITLFINNQSIVLQNVVDFIEIDSEMKDCFKGTVSQNGNLLSDWPTLDPGENDISWTGNVSKIEVVPRWVSL